MDPTHIRRRRESSHIPDHSAAQCNDCTFAVESMLEKRVPQFLDVFQIFVRFPGRDSDELWRKPCLIQGSHHAFGVELCNIFIGDDNWILKSAFDKQAAGLFYTACKDIIFSHGAQVKAPKSLLDFGCILRRSFSINCQPDCK